MRQENKKKRDRISGPGRPLRGDKKRIRVSFTMHPSDALWLKQQAVKANMTKSEILDQLLHEGQIQGRLALDNLTGKGKGSRLRLSIPQKEIIVFCIKHHIVKLSLFGSVLTARFGPESDIDVLVTFEKDHEPGYFDISIMETEFGKLFGGRKIDFKTVEELSRYFRDEVIQDAQEIYAA